MVKCSELSLAITDVAMIIAARKNVKDIDDVMEQMAGFFPDVPREAIIDAIVEATTQEAKTVDDLAKKLAEIKREAKTDKALREKIADLEDFIETGELPAKLVRARKDVKSIDLLREIRDSLKKDLAKSEPAQKKKIKEQIKVLEERLESGDILPKIREKIVPDSKELQRLEFERDKLKQEIRSRIYSLKPKSLIETVVEPFNFVRLIQTTGEFSLALRQAGWIAYSHPIIFGRDIIKMFQAFASEQVAAEVNHALINRDLAPIGFRAKLFVAPTEGSVRLSSQEEVIMSHWFDKIPVVKNFTRAGLTFLNAIRADMFDVLYRTLGRVDGVTEGEAEIIANYVNTSTGRGTAVLGERAAVGLNTIFYAPRYVASRFQMLMGHPIWARHGKGSARVRKLIALEYGRMFLGLSTVYTLGLLAGGDIEHDPRSTDFGKIRFGITRLDPLMGLSQVTVLLTRLFTGETKSTRTGKIVPIRPKDGKKVPFGGTTTSDVIQRFLRYKLSPLFGTTWTLLAKEDPIGREVTPELIAKTNLSPITWGDILDAMIALDVARGTALSILAVFGMGLQTYEDRRVIETFERNKRKLD